MSTSSTQSMQVDMSETTGSTTTASQQPQHISSNTSPNQFLIDLDRLKLLYEAKGMSEQEFDKRRKEIIDRATNTSIQGPLASPQHQTPEDIQSYIRQNFGQFQPFTFTNLTQINPSEDLNHAPDNYVGDRFTFQNQIAARRIYLDCITKMYNEWSTIGDASTCEPAKLVKLPVLCGAGGIGKTTFVRKALEKELQDPSSPRGEEITQLVRDCVEGSMIFRLDLREGIDFIVRLLYVSITFAPKRVDYDTFQNIIKQMWPNLTLKQAIDFIRFINKIPKDSTRLEVLHIDETNQITNTSGSSYLQNILLSITQSTVLSQDTFIVCALSGTHAIDLYSY
ncbi:hypothetical protein DFA_01956 [Cavenderia fasciculata]|uniref:Uncharacterized protein n=1 Tax=Cavenderia fasciculata TaxID=261658 RepID=F4PR09_CACFS|nr:uncharacterized protein DFA_01956 [Cavenderia fasciculata]EGG22066.1 hypothetical protein DFA_01956 [Cavenderia fasciculata]|eukprot:XP_004359917.1 hypothetical protein DFA_01956 [Cavenderia fasciculata]